VRGSAAPDATRDPYLARFVIELGAALNAAGEPCYSVQDRLTEVARAYGASSVRVSAFPTFLMVTMGVGQPATLELTTSHAGTSRLDQIAELDRLLGAAQRAAIPPAEGLRRLAEIQELRARFGHVQGILGYAVLSLGLCLILHPAPRDVVAAAVFGAVVGLLRTVGRRQSVVQFLMPILAAFCVSALSALAVKHGVTDPGLRAMVAALVVFLPGAALTTAVLELTAGQTVSGSSRLVAGAMQLALLAFGILAGIEAVGVPSARVFSGSSELLGDWGPWLGVLVFAVGVTVANSAPARSFPGLPVVLYAAWIGQVVGNALFGGYVSALVGAAVMTPVAFWVSRLPSAMPPLASFLPGFWLLVPGALGLIGFTELAGSGGDVASDDLVATVVSIFAIAIGVLCGNLLLASALGTGRMVRGLSKSLGERTRRRRAPTGRTRRRRFTATR
jgi:uncharacterized membrane protein YjjP (DUF1212 family)